MWWTYTIGTSSRMHFLNLRMNIVHSTFLADVSDDYMATNATHASLTFLDTLLLVFLQLLSITGLMIDASNLSVCYSEELIRSLVCNR